MRLEGRTTLALVRTQGTTTRKQRVADTHSHLQYPRFDRGLLTGLEWAESRCIRSRILRVRGRPNPLSGSPFIFARRHPHQASISWTFIIARWIVSLSSFPRGFPFHNSEYEYDLRLTTRGLGPVDILRIHLQASAWAKPVMASVVRALRQRLTVDPLQRRPLHHRRSCHLWL
jgi:hypothetical protein